MPRYQLVDKVMFVEAYCMDNPGNKPPSELPFPHILDQRLFELPTRQATYTQLSPAEAFITRFIVMGVDTNLVSDIYASEAGANNNDAKGAVQGVVDLLNSHQYIQPRVARNYNSALDPRYPREGTQDRHGQHTLDFKCNWYGSGQSKVPY